MRAGVLPLRNSFVFSPVLVSKKRITVPVCEATAAMLPEKFKTIATTPDLLHYIDVDDSQ